MYDILDLMPTKAELKAICEDHEEMAWMLIDRLGWAASPEVIAYLKLVSEEDAATRAMKGAIDTP